MQNKINWALIRKEEGYIVLAVCYLVGRFLRPFGVVVCISHPHPHCLSYGGKQAP